MTDHFDLSRPADELAIKLGQVRDFVVTLIIGGVGGAIFSLIDLPLPWTIGSIFFASAAGILGVRIYVPQVIITFSRIILALVIGSRISPDFFFHLTQWSDSVAGLIVCVISSSALCYLFLRYAVGYSAPTAYYSALPGGFDQMTLLGTEAGGDDKVISIIQTFRQFIIVISVPIFINILSVEDFTKSAAAVSHSQIYGFGGPIDLMWMVMSAAIGYYIARVLKIPVGGFIGPLIVFGFVSSLGLTSSAPPQDISAISQIFIGGSYGVRFRGVEIKFLRKTIFISILSTLIHINMMMLFIFVFFIDSNHYLRTDNMVIAFSPGGIIEMAILAFSLGEDISYVSLHHIIRTVGLLIFAPIYYKNFINKDKS
jgi:hypothetical protein